MLRQLKSKEEICCRLKGTYESRLEKYEFLSGNGEEQNAVALSDSTEDAIVMLLQDVLTRYGDQWRKSFSYPLIYQQLEAMTKDPQGVRWNLDVINFFIEMQSNFKNVYEITNVGRETISGWTLFG